MKYQGWFIAFWIGLLTISFTGPFFLVVVVILGYIFKEFGAFISSDAIEWEEKQRQKKKLGKSLAEITDKELQKAKVEIDWKNYEKAIQIIDKLEARLDNHSGENRDEKVRIEEFKKKHQGMIKRQRHGTN
jgi:hypothetical protein